MPKSTTLEFVYYMSLHVSNSKKYMGARFVAHANELQLAWPRAIL